MQVTSIPEGFAHDEGQINGLAEARARCGPAEQHHVILNVSAEALAYWDWQRRKRIAEVVLALRRPDGGYLLHTKAFYPADAYRLLSGGLKPGEAILEGVRREAAEETGLGIEDERFLAVIYFEFRHAKDTTRFTSFLFAASTEKGPLNNQDPGEQITDFRVVPLATLHAVADALDNLPPNWLDWGRFRAFPHRLAARLLADPTSGEHP